MADRYVVVAPLIVVKVPGAQGGEAYMKRGRLLPSSVRSAEIDRLLELELIELDPVTLAEAAAATLLLEQQAAADAAAQAAADQAEAEKAASEQKKPAGK